MSALSWMNDAACAEVGLELFYPEVGEYAPVAKRVCAACRVRAECLEDAMANMGTYGTGAGGIWGGLTEGRRRALARQRERGAA